MMYPRYASRVLILGTIAVFTAAQDCNISNGSTLFISSPDDLTQRIQDCPEINGSIVFETSYNSNIELPNLVTLGGKLSANLMANNSFIDLPNLERSGDGLDVVAWNVSAPKLNETLDIEVLAGVVRLDSLVRARNIDVSSEDLSTINLSSLRNVTQRLHIGHCTDCDTEYEPEHGIRLDFAALQFAGYIHIEGQIRSLLMPQLTTLGPPYDPGSYMWALDDEDYSAGLLLDLDESPETFELDLPRLSYVDTHFEISGNVAGVSLPSLTETRTDINLHGAIERATLNLTSFNTITISSTTSFDCDAFTETLTQSSNHFEDNSSISCTSTSNSGLSTRAKIIIGVVVPIIVFLVLGEVLWCRHHRAASKRRKAMRGPNAGSEIELPMRFPRPGAGQTVVREGTPPPPYGRNE